MPSKERQTADKLVAAYNALDIDTIIALRTPDCERAFLPSTSLKYPPQSNTSFRQNLTGLAAVFTSFSIVVDDVIEGTNDAGATRIVMYVSAFGETAAGPYRNQYVWRMGFSEDGGLIKEWTEFVDVGVARDYYPKLKEEIIKKMQGGQGP